MSAKRQATTSLNHENWDREEEPEERGTFRAAPEDELNKRVIKKARRKIPGTSVDAVDDGEGATKSVFSGFAGFGKSASASGTSQAAAASSPFSFLSKLPTAGTSTTSGSASTTTASKPTFSFGGAATATATETIKLETNKTTAMTATATSAESSNKSAYFAKLKGLNQAVSNWIKTHVDKNPLCILTPIFKDYQNYLQEIENDKKSTNTAEVISNVNPPAATANTTSFGSFKFSATSSPATVSETKTTTASNIFGSIEKPNTSEAPKTNGFSFGLKTDDKPTPKTSGLPGFTFGNPSSSSNSTDNAEEKKPAAVATGFSFTPGAAPFSFGNIQPPAAMPTATSNADEDDEEDQPPKVEFKQVVEEDAVYSKKCKVFVKKDGNFADRGVGTVFLKPVKDADKTQLLVRADTNLGNILVNLILSAGIPAQRMGKNNVMLVCLPTPDVDKPTPMLLRVKTAEEADELLATIEKYKK